VNESAGLWIPYQYEDDTINDYETESEYININENMIEHEYNYDRDYAYT
jgi:hypothetical protein